MKTLTTYLTGVELSPYATLSLPLGSGMNSRGAWTEGNRYHFPTAASMHTLAKSLWFVIPQSHCTSLGKSALVLDGGGLPGGPLIATGPVI